MRYVVGVSLEAGLEAGLEASGIKASEARFWQTSLHFCSRPGLEAGLEAGLEGNAHDAAHALRYVVGVSLEPSLEAGLDRFCQTSLQFLLDHSGRTESHRTNTQNSRRAPGAPWG